MGWLEVEWLLPSDKSDSVAALLYSCWGTGNRYKKLQDQRFRPNEGPKSENILNGSTRVSEFRR